MKRNYIFNSIFAAAAMSLLSLTTSCDDNDYDSYSLNTSYAAPTVSSVSPSEGLPTSIVTITGSNFGSEQHFEDRIGRVYFGGVEATEIVSWSDTEIKARVPEDGRSGVIDVWVWKNHSESTTEFTCIPGAEITSVDPDPVMVGGDLTLIGKNFDYFIRQGITPEQISVEFASTVSGESVITCAKEFTSTTIVVTVPEGVAGGPVVVSLGNLQKINSPSISLIGDLTIDTRNYVAINDVNGKDNMVAEDGSIGNTKNGSYVIYEFVAPATGTFDVSVLVGTTKSDRKLNLFVSDNINAAVASTEDDGETIDFPNTGSWACETKLNWSPINLEYGKTYYLKLTFLAPDGSWVGNCASGIKLSLSSYSDEVGYLTISTIDYAAINDVNGKDNMVAEDGSIGNTKNGSYVVYEFVAPGSGKFNATMLCGTTKSDRKLNMMIGSNLEAIKEASTDEEGCTIDFPNTGSWACETEFTWGPFELEKGKTYYLKLTFLAPDGSWVGNCGPDINLTKVNE